MLRDVDDDQGTRHLEAKVKGKGDLVIEGQDLGAGVQRTLGFDEYEWVLTIRARDVPSLSAALGTPSDLLLALRERFSGDRAAELDSFLKSHDIPYETWTWMGE